MTSTWQDVHTTAYMCSSETTQVCCDIKFWQYFNNFRYMFEDRVAPNPSKSSEPTSYETYHLPVCDQTWLAGKSLRQMEVFSCEQLRTKWWILQPLFHVAPMECLAWCSNKPWPWHAMAKVGTWHHLHLEKRETVELDEVRGATPPQKKISSASKFIHHVPFEQFWTWFIKLAGLTAHGQDFSRYRTRLKGPVMNNGPVNTECTRVSWPGIAYRKSLGTHADSHTSCFTGVKLWELNSAWFLRFLLLPSKFCAVSVCVQNLQEEVKLHAFGQAIVQHDRGMYPQNLVTTIGKLLKCFHFHVLILVTQWLSHRSHLDLQVYRNSNDSPATCDHSDVIGDKRLLPSSFHSRIWILSSPQSRRGCDLQLPCLIAGCKLHSVKLLCKLV